jgi:hypothetical protein
MTEPDSTEQDAATADLEVAGDAWLAAAGQQPARHAQDRALYAALLRWLNSRKPYEPGRAGR